MLRVADGPGYSEERQRVQDDRGPRGDGSKLAESALTFVARIAAPVDGNVIPGSEASALPATAWSPALVDAGTAASSPLHSATCVSKSPSEPWQGARPGRTGPALSEAITSVPRDVQLGSPD